MRDSFLSRRASAVRPSWARALQRAALLLAASVALFGSSLAVGRWTVSLPGSEFIYGDVLLAWIGMVAYVSAWPNLWAGLRDLQARQPTDSNGVVAWRAFSLSLLVAVATVVVLLLQYHALASPAGRSCRPLPSMELSLAASLVPSNPLSNISRTSERSSSSPSPLQRP